MKTVGEILHTARIQQRLSYDDIARKTKIHVKYLKAIEANEFDRLPASTFTKGFLRKFSEEVKLQPENVLAIFRRDYDQDKHGRIVPRSLAEPIKSSHNWFTPTTLTLLFSALIGIVVVGFFVRQVLVFRSAPPLVISSPDDGVVVSSPVLVTGSTDAQASVRVNNRPVSVSPTGDFSAEIPLTPGEHTLVVTATNRLEKSTSQQRIIQIRDD